MDERNYRSNRQDEENETKQTENRNSSGTDESSYYYSYGPFQSVNQEDTANHMGSNNQREEGNVEITKPDPVRPVPTYYNNQSSEQATRSTGGGGNGSGNGGDQGNGGKGNWNYNNRKPRSSVRSLLFSLLPACWSLPFSCTQPIEQTCSHRRLHLRTRKIKARDRKRPQTQVEATM